MSAREDVALVTGASRGIGRAIAVALARQGMRVVAVGRSADRLEELAKESAVEPVVAPIGSPEGCAEVSLGSPW